MDFSKYTFRASQSSKLATGTIGLTEGQKETLINHVTRKSQAALGEKDIKGKPIKPLTAKMEEELQELSKKQKDKTIPKTMKSELRAIYRAEKHSRNFQFSNDFTEKGLKEEEEAISVYQQYLREVKGRSIFFLKNTKRFYGEYFEGEPDIFDDIDHKKIQEGFDTKCSWSLKTFPFAEDDLDEAYEWQNQIYMHLTGVKKWTTASVLVNISEDGLHKQKMKKYYNLGSPEPEDGKYYDEYINECKKIEKMLVFDYDRFFQKNPNYNDFVITEDEWFTNNYDIPLKDKVVEKVSIYNPDKIKYITERARIGRDYMNKLFKDGE